MKKGHTKISATAEADYLADVAQAANFDAVLRRAAVAEQAYRRAQALAAPAEEKYQLARDLDIALTDATLAAYAAQRAEIGPQGYEDRIYRRKAMATSAVHAWTDEAERLLTLRETHRLTGFPARSLVRVIGAEVAKLPASNHS